MKLKKLIFTKNYTWKKAYNLFLAKVQWKIFKNSKVITFPASGESVKFSKGKTAMVRTCGSELFSTWKWVE